MDKFVIERTKAVTGQEVVELRESASWADGSAELWQKCIDQSLCVITARAEKTDELVGVAFVTGNVRHAQLCDGVVRPSWREHGVGGAALEELLRFAREEEIAYVGLTYDINSPWLKDFYGRHGFFPVDFAMWHSDSLKRIGIDVESKA